MDYSTRRQNENPKGSIFNGLIGLIVTLIVIALAVVGLYNYQISKPQNKESGTKVITVEKGENRDQIGKKLVDAKIIDSASWFTLYFRVSNEGGDIQAGNHPIPQNVSIKEIVEEFEKTPQTDQVWVTIPEGLRADEIRDALELAFSNVEESKFNLSEYNKIVKDPASAELTPKAKAFIAKYLPAGKPLEGFIYPDTYSFETKSTSVDIISRMVETLEKKLTEQGALSNLSNNDLYSKLIVASMLEREAFTNDEAEMISDIIYRRLEQNFPLGIDATSLYALKDWKATLTFKELADPNPYNTRINTGLIPTPIANPGIDNILAALNPKSNDYFYYLHGSNGKIYYAKTNAEHESNKRYL